MNKLMVVIAVVITAFFIDLGLGLKTQTTGIKKQRNDVVSENRAFSDEIGQKQKFKENKPRTISKAFALFVNETKMFETYSGTQMSIVFNGLPKENENIEDNYVDTAFRNVKGLPLTITVEKFSDQTDMVEVLNDIYLLENRTDFKVSEISTQDNTLIVKGELYGI